MIGDWITLFEGTHNPTESGWVRWCWPDGRSLLEQPVPTVRALNILRAEANLTLREELRKAKDGGTRRHRH